MSTTPRLSLIGLYNYNNELFDSMKIPEGIDKDLLINNILLDYGESQVLYNSWDMMRSAIGLWSNKWYNSFIKLNEVLLQDYNPLHNYDRYEKVEDSSTGNVKNSGKDSVDTDMSDENTISAYNSNTYQPDNKGITKGNNTTNYGHNMDTTNGYKHDAHLFGNIGVTTSQQMLLDELSLRSTNNIYDIIAEIFRRELLLFIF